MRSLRTPTTQAKYDDFRASGGLNDGCGLCQAESIQDFNYWRIIDNRFPYDLVAETHHMLVPKRHAAEDDLTPAEAAEFIKLRKELITESKYQFLIEATSNTKSVPTHAHLHLLIIKHTW